MSPRCNRVTRRDFVRGVAAATTFAGAASFGGPWLGAAEGGGGAPPGPGLAGGGRLPEGPAPAPVAAPHFPDRLHAFVWRNWTLVPTARLAEVVGATAEQMRDLGEAMGLPPPPRITPAIERRAKITVIKRNWHLLPYDQLLVLLGWTEEELAYALREDDFLYIKLGSLKPRCAPLRYARPTAGAKQRAAEIARVLREEFPAGLPAEHEPLFHFVAELSAPPVAPSAPRPAPLAPPREADAGRSGSGPAATAPQGAARLTPRFGYSYFALYGDPLLEPEADPYPEGYLARLAQTGVDGVWLQGVLSRLAPFPWEPARSARHEERLRQLRVLVARARRHGIGVYLYLNEPRALPRSFYAERPELRGVTEGDHAALCTSVPAVQDYLRGAVAHICRAVPDLAGFFTITASENLTNCWSHHRGQACPRCGARSPAEVVAEVNRQVGEGIRSAGSAARLLAWDWGWADAWAAEAIQRLPAEAALMSVSEWSLPLARGGVASKVGEYSISAIGPGPRATRHWQLARERGLRTLAKIQAGNTWELAAVPYIPAVGNVARHVARVRAAGIDGLMLGWTLGGYPSPNLEVATALATDATLTAEAAMRRVAERRFGAGLAPAVVAAWEDFSAAFAEFPYHTGVVYAAPLQVGPANLLWREPTGYQATMVGFPYDHLDKWRAVYPVEVFIAQLEKVADGFDAGLARWERAVAAVAASGEERAALAREQGVARAAALHFRSVAWQARFVREREAWRRLPAGADPAPLRAALAQAVRAELVLAKRLWALQRSDARLGFEASNHYFYVPQDLLEKVVNCRQLLDDWLEEGGRETGERRQAGGAGSVRAGG